MLGRADGAVDKLFEATIPDHSVALHPANRITVVPT